MRTLRFPLFFFFLLIAYFPVKSEASWYMQVRGSYFYPTSKELRDSFSRVWLDYQFEIETDITCQWQTWANVGWTLKEGGKHYFDGFEEKNRLWILPISTGVRYLFPVTPCVNLYLGAGVSYTFIRLQEKFPYYSDFKKYESDGQWGIVGKSGLQWVLSDYTFLELFADYYTHRFKVSRHNSEYSLGSQKIDLSGFKFGLGFGVYF